MSAASKTREGACASLPASKRAFHLLRAFDVIHNGSRNSLMILHPQQLEYVDEGSRTFVFGDEDHTLGNSLRHVLMGRRVHHQHRWGLH